MKFKETEVPEDVRFNLTPMIDVTFQLIIFFMLATDLANVTLERVWLPKAVEVEEDKPPKDRLVINIVHLPGAAGCKELRYKDGKLDNPCQNPEHWKIKIKGKEIKIAELERVVALEADLDREPPDPRAPNLPGLSKRKVMIRGDAGTPYKILEKVYQACARPGARIWQVEIGASQERRKK